MTSCYGGSILAPQDVPVAAAVHVVVHLRQHLPLLQPTPTGAASATAALSVSALS